MNNKDFKALFPNAHFVAAAIAAVIFFCVIGFGFVIGAVWQGLRVGFLLGRDID